MTEIKHRYFVLHKPFNMVSQFISTHQVGLLTDIDFTFPKGTHAIGRLDKDSEGLLLLTTNTKITRLLFLSAVPHKRTYLVQINNKISSQNLLRLQTGVSFKIKSGVSYTTVPCQVSIIQNPNAYCKMAERLTAYSPYTWLLLTTTEGKYHQVRKMIGAINHKVKRLIRISIENLSLNDLPTGQVKELNEVDFFTQLRLN